LSFFGFRIALKSFHLILHEPNEQSFLALKEKSEAILAGATSTKQTTKEK